jgi:hypothetical protein
MRMLLNDKSVNNLAVAFIVGVSTVAYVSSAGTMILNVLFDVSGTVWEWNSFLIQTIVYAVSLTVAMWFRNMAK